VEIVRHQIDEIQVAATKTRIVKQHQLI
jgi:hypothetical protein